MSTRREYLIDKGLAQPGRGRFSTDAQAALVTARSEGVTFDDDKGGSEGEVPSP